MSFGPDIFTSVINSYLPEPHASLLNGILFGINLKTARVFLEQLRTVGLLHLVVLSGSNISLLAGIVGTTTRYLSKSISILITLLIVIIFIVFVGPQAPIVRAGIMAIYTFVAIALGKKRLALVSLISSFMFIALFWPAWLSSVSLLLSYGATIGIIVFHRDTSFRSDGNENIALNKCRVFANYCRNEFRLSLSAQVFTVPVIFITFRQISLVSPFANVLVAWLVGPLMVFGFVTAVLGKINPMLGWMPAMVCYGLLSYMIWIIRALSQLPFASINF